MPPGQTPCESHAEMERRLREIEHASIRSEKDVAVLLLGVGKLEATVQSLRNWQMTTAAVISAGTFLVLNWDRIKLFFSN